MGGSRDSGRAVRFRGLRLTLCGLLSVCVAAATEFVNSPDNVVRPEQSLSLQPWVVASGLSVVLFAWFLWNRERRLRGSRERLRKIYHLGEEILGASSAEAVLKRIAETLPSILGVTRVHLYVYNRAAKTLDGVIEQTGEAVSISLGAPPAGTQSGAAACFHYRTLLMIPDVNRSPFPIATADETAPKSLLFVPMMAQGEVIGVMESTRKIGCAIFPATSRRWRSTWETRLARRSACWDSDRFRNNCSGRKSWRPWGGSFPAL